MAKNQTVKIKPSILAKDLKDFAALKTIKGYKTSNPAYEIAAVEADNTAREAAMQAEAQAEADLKTKRDLRVAADWKFHASMEGGRTSVESQFGKDSNELQAIGRKKASEYKSRSAKPKADVIK